MKRFGVRCSRGVDTLKTLVSVAVIVYLAWSVLEAVIADSLGMPWLAPRDAALIGVGARRDAVVARPAWALALLALGDYALQHYRHTKSLKMTAAGGARRGAARPKATPR